MSPAEGNQLRTVAAGLHAAPAPLSIPCELMEYYAASRVRAALDPIEFVIAKQIARRLGDARKQLARPIQSPAKFRGEPPSCVDHFDAGLAFGEKPVNRGDSGVRARFGSALERIRPPLSESLCRILRASWIWPNNREGPVPFQAGQLSQTKRCIGHIHAKIRHRTRNDSLLFASLTCCGTLRPR